MKRINVVGTSGSGKSTLSEQLANVLNYPYIEMDALFWNSGWQQTPDELFFAKIERALEPDLWVLDGNYSRSNHIKYSKVDTIVWVDYSFYRTLYQACSRAIFRCLSKQELWQGTGLTESFKQTFFSRDSVLLWTLQTYKSNKLKYQKMMQASEYQHIRFIRIKSPREAKLFLKQIGDCENEN